MSEMRAARAWQAAGGVFDPVALHHVNIGMLRGGDVLVASYPGSGAALLGNVLLELGLWYADPYTEILSPDGTAGPAPERAAYRRRLAATTRRDAATARPAPGGVRFVKTHLLPRAFGRPGEYRVILLVRDPRDAIFSYYNWRLGFSEEGESRSFEEFLRDHGSSGIRPIADWTRFYTLWREYPRAPDMLDLVTFEALKSTPVAALRELMRALGIPRSRADLAAAAERSSFEAMRRHEDRAAPERASARIMRRGTPGEWRDWYTGGLASCFKGRQFRLLAHALGYEL
jgi:Sulfotransferase domain